MTHIFRSAHQVLKVASLAQAEILQSLFANDTKEVCKKRHSESQLYYVLSSEQNVCNAAFVPNSHNTFSSSVLTFDPCRLFLCACLIY